MKRPTGAAPSRRRQLTIKHNWEAVRPMTKALSSRGGGDGRHLKAHNHASPRVYISADDAEAAAAFAATLPAFYLVGGSYASHSVLAKSSIQPQCDCLSKLNCGRLHIIC